MNKSKLKCIVCGRIAPPEVIDHDVNEQYHCSGECLEESIDADRYK